MVSNSSEERDMCNSFKGCSSVRSTYDPNNINISNNLNVNLMSPVINININKINKRDCEELN